MSYVSWPDVASIAFVENLINSIPKSDVYLQVVPVPQANTIGPGTNAYITPLIVGYTTSLVPQKKVCIKVDGNYTVAGSGSDQISIIIHDFQGQILFEKKQVWNDGPGGGTRSGVLLPLMCVLDYAKVKDGFRVFIQNLSTNDTLTLDTITDIHIKVTQATV
jgi:hypothetical protein